MMRMFGGLLGFFVVLLACNPIGLGTDAGEDGSDEGGDGDGDDDGGGSGGTSSSSGVGGTENLGGSASGGTSNSTFCKTGETAPCASKHVEFPVGTTTCSGGVWPTTGCKRCEAGQQIACGEIPFHQGNQFGTAVCDATAESGRGGWDTSTCEVCEAGETVIDCVKIVGGAREYTGGSAVCNSTGDGWLEGTCNYCGDGAKNGASEQCDGADVTPTTCGALDFGGVDPSTVVSTCAAGCHYDTSQCGNCSGSVQAGMCMDGGACAGSACDEKGCARDASCTFNCYEGNGPCEDTTCSEGATCTYQCYSSGPGAQGGCPGTICKAGAHCTFRCFNNPSDCTDLKCEDGAECDFECQNGGICSTSGTAICKSGDECIINCENAADCTGMKVFCESGSICHIIVKNNDAPPTVDCESGAICHLNCGGRTCNTVTCAGPTCHCNEGSCPGFPG